MLKLALTLLAFLAVLFVLVRLLETRLVFHPMPMGPDVLLPVHLGLSPENHYFQTEDGIRLHGWHFRQPKSTGVLLFLHGNAGNIAHRLDMIARLMRAVKTDIFIFDYRGFGRSEGTPTEQGVYRDARAAYSLLRDSLGYAPDKIVIYGRSLGGAIAAQLATEVPAAGAVFEATFSSAKDMARTLWPILPIAWMSSTRFEAAKAVATVQIPKLFIHGDLDEIVPLSLGQKLYSAAAEPKTWLTVPGAGHNNVYVVGGKLYTDAFREFTEACLATELKKE